MYPFFLCMGSFAIAVGCDELSLARGQTVSPPKMWARQGGQGGQSPGNGANGRKKSGPSKQSKILSKSLSQKPKQKP
jgi:hypothetical protein